MSRSFLAKPSIWQRRFGMPRGLAAKVEFASSGCSFQKALGSEFQSVPEHASNAAT